MEENTVENTDITTSAPSTDTEDKAKEMKDKIIDAMKYVKENSSPNIIWSKTLINTIFTMLCAIYIDGKKYIILNAPTGSGKTLIGIILHRCMCVLDEYDEAHSYFLTNSKQLQDQIDNDIPRFELEEELTILKGTSNYTCVYTLDKYQEAKDKFGINNPDMIKTYDKRKCKNNETSPQFADCITRCPYKLKRQEASVAHCAVLNYYYFTTVLNTEYSEYFSDRRLTICDEAHNLPSIIEEYTKHTIDERDLSRLDDKASSNLDIGDNKGIMDIIYKKEITIDDLITHYKVLASVYNKLRKKEDEYDTDLGADDGLRHCNNTLEMLENLKDHPEDFFINIERKEDKKVYNHKYRSPHTTTITFANLNISKAVERRLLSHANIILFMSATMGDVNNFMDIMGLPRNLVASIDIPSNFDFSKSPIYLTNSGLLTAQYISTNLWKVFGDVIKICNKHPNEKGIIHTHTSKITAQFREYVNVEGIAGRFLFYENAREKQENINIMSSSSEPYILVGPSIVEGVDMKDDLCRFNILIKVPYPGIDEYIKEKMKRYTGYYSEATRNNIIQAIGRGNRHKDDYSTTYLMDTKFREVICTIPNIIDKIIIN